MTLDNIKKFFTSAHVLHMEAEIAHLRGQNAMLLLELKNALAPQPTPHVKREFPKITPAKTSWETYLAAEIAKQEVEDGTHSSGR